MTVPDATPRTYEHCGLRIRSALDLDLPAAAGDVTRYDLEVRWGEDVGSALEPPAGELIASYGEGPSWWYAATEVDGGYVLRFRGVGEFAVAGDLRTVDVRRAPGGRHELLPILMAGTVSAFVLGLGGRALLHASAVSFDEQVVAFVGQSGRGKSTLAALMCAAGAELVTDDLLVIDGTRPVTCIGGARSVRLRPSAAILAEALPDAALGATADGRTSVSPHAAPSASRPLSAIVIPRPSRDARHVELEPVEPTAALVALLLFPRVHGWRRADVLRRDLAVLGEVVATVPVFDATIPWGPPFDPSVATTISSLAHPA